MSLKSEYYKLVYNPDFDEWEARCMIEGRYRSLTFAQTGMLARSIDQGETPLHSTFTRANNAFSKLVDVSFNYLFRDMMEGDTWAQDNI